VLHLDATFLTFVQGPLHHGVLLLNGGMSASLCDLGEPVSDRTLVLNLLCGLNESYDHLRTWITHSFPFSCFHKIHNDLILEELTKGAPPHSDGATALYSSTFRGQPLRSPSTPALGGLSSCIHACLSLYCSAPCALPSSPGLRVQGLLVAITVDGRVAVGVARGMLLGPLFTTCGSTTSSRGPSCSTRHLALLHRY
jgi:hypothetical protein